MAENGREYDSQHHRPRVLKEQHNGKLTDLSLNERKLRDRQERETIVLWRRPIITLQYFFLETVIDLKEWALRLWQRRGLVLITLMVLAMATMSYYVEGTHQKYVQFVEKKMVWCVYWVGLGILSSVGLGTGLHTFLLYLGPHIASVTLAAYECNSVNFPEPPYPDKIICPDEEMQGTISLWVIISKVRLEACMWGAGTAIGELPPYFMARAARLSGAETDEEFEEALERDKNAQDLPTRAKLAVQNLVQKVGFFGILACASIPNPLFDLAGITCGHFLVPFWTFFGATLIGKAIIKMHIQVCFKTFLFDWVFGHISSAPLPCQLWTVPSPWDVTQRREGIPEGFTMSGAQCAMYFPLFDGYSNSPDFNPAATTMEYSKLFVIITFSKHIVEQMVSLIGAIPSIGPSLQKPFQEYLEAQRAKLHKSEAAAGASENWLSWVFEKVVILMVFYFILSILNSMAQSYAKRIQVQKYSEEKMK